MKLRLDKVLEYALAVLVVALSSSVYAEDAKPGKEWREVFRMDFGGNETTDPGLSTVQPSTEDIITELEFASEFVPFGSYSLGKYYVAKNTADISDGTKNAADMNNWYKGSDHTYPDDPTKGYCMMFDCKVGDEVVVFEKALNVPCKGVRFCFSAWIANIAKIETECNVSIGMFKPNGDHLSLEQEELWKKREEDGGLIKNVPASKGKIEWSKYETTFEVPDDADYSTVLFRILSRYNSGGTGWDFALDDILIEVEQPILSISNDRSFSYNQPVNLIADYDEAAIDTFFNFNYSNVNYRWERSDSKDGPWKTVEMNAYKKGSKMPFEISKFSKDEYNGWYRLTVASGASIDNGFCSIQQVFQINEQRDKCYVTICQDSSKTILGNTISASTPGTPYTDPISGKQYTEIDMGSIVYYVDEYKYTKKPDYKSYTCKKADNELGEHLIDSVFTKVKIDDETTCIDTKEYLYEVVEESPSLPDKHLCRGVKFRGTAYNDVLENGFEVSFDSADGCSYKQIIYVHDSYIETSSFNNTTTKEVFVCKGDEYMGRVLDKPGKYTDFSSRKEKTVLYGCDSIVKPIVIVPEIDMPPVIEMDPICQKDMDGKVNSVTFGSRTYTEPMDKIVYDTVPSKLYGCDSINSAHIIIYPSGTVGPFDTLICRDQILFGEEFTTAGTFNRSRFGTNAYGCSIDTLWRVQVVEVQLKLRVAFLGNNPVICQGTPLDLNVTLLPPDAKFRWEPSIGTNSFRPTLWPEKSTVYTAYADLDLPSDIDHDAKGCHAKDEVRVEVHPQPVIQIDSVDVDNRNVEYSIEGGTKPYTLNMDTKSLGEFTENFGTLEKQPYGTHTLQVVDSTGCTSEAPFSIEAKPLEPVAYFSPNGDGENDLWTIGNIDVYPTARIRIYDRLGRVLYDVKGYENENGFDGTYNGHKLPATDYWYEIDVEELDKQYVGHFTLLR